jgi:hypothetical protein
VRWLAGTNNIFRKNLLNTETGIPGIAGWTQHLNQPDPYGVRDNHKVGIGDLCTTTLDDPTNLDFENFDEYTAYLTENETDPYGSDLDIENFWTVGALASCHDGTINGDESEIDCGGSCESRE